MDGQQPVKKLDVRTTATGENVIADLTRKEIVSVAEFDKIYKYVLYSTSPITHYPPLSSSIDRASILMDIGVMFVVKPP